MSAKDRWGHQSRFRITLRRYGVEINRGILLANNKEDAEIDGFFVLGGELFDEAYICCAEELDA